MIFPRGARVAAIGGALVLALAACSAPGEGQAAEPTPQETTTQPVEGCAVSGPAGFDDAGANQQTLAGLTMAKNDGRLGGTQSLRTSSFVEADAAVQSLLDSGCSVIAVPAQAAAAARSLAGSQPDVPFVLVGGGAEDLPENVATLGFDQRGAAFLSGYAAAALSESGTVATIGGVRDRGTVRAMDAFAAGVEQFNDDQQDGAQEPTPSATEGAEDAPRSVTLVGWDRDERTGRFAREESDVRAALREAVDDGADVVFPVAGEGNTAVVRAMEEAAEDGGDEALADVRLVWTGADGRTQLPDTIADNVLAGVVWHVDVGYEAVLTEWSTGTERSPLRLRAREWTGTLENEGVTFLGPSETELLTSVGLDGRLDELRSALLEGEIDLG